MHAETINELGLENTYFGLKDYASHPQLIGPVIAYWTQAFGYSEASIRLLALSLTILATALLTLAVRAFVGGRRALIFLLFFASLPLVYIYGKKLDQELLVMVFLGLHLWGIGLFDRSKWLGLILAGLGSLGMMLSDWSGAVFSLVIAVSVFLMWGWKERKKDIILFTFVSGVASVFGLVLFLFQSFLQSSASSFADFLSGYITLWQYRTGVTTSGFTLWAWPVNQINFLLVNFGIPLFLAGVLGFFKGFRTAVVGSEKKVQQFFIVILGVFVASTLYMLAVPQASAIHVYFQFYWSVPLAVGLVFFAEWMTRFFKSQKRHSLLIAITLVIFGVSAVTTIHEYSKLLFVNSWGNKTDVALLQSLKDIPESEIIITLNENPLALDWFVNPNITYYTGRNGIEGFLFDDGAPLTDYIILPKVYANDVTAFIESGAGYGAEYSAVLERCSDNLCLIHVFGREP